MKNLFHNLINSLFCNQSKNKKKKNTSLGNIKFILNENDKISMLCDLPSVSQESPDDISVVAEKYAKFLLHITDGSAVQDITQALKKQSDKDDPETVLLIDNVLYFWELLFQENQKKLYKDFFSKEPLIKPSSVFSLKN